MHGDLNVTRILPKQTIAQANQNYDNEPSQSFAMKYCNDENIFVEFLNLVDSLVVSQRLETH